MGIATQETTEVVSEEFEWGVLDPLVVAWWGPVTLYTFSPWSAITVTFHTPCNHHYNDSLHPLDLPWHPVDQPLISDSTSATIGVSGSTHWPMWLCGCNIWQLSNSLLCWAFLVKSLSDECPINLPTQVQIMTWCHQALSHYLSKCWPWSSSLYDVPNEWSIVKILLALFHLSIILWFHFLHMTRQLSCHDISKNVVPIGPSFPISEEHIFYMQTFFFYQFK